MARCSFLVGLCTKMASSSASTTRTLTNKGIRCDTITIGKNYSTCLCSNSALLTRSSLPKPNQKDRKIQPLSGHSYHTYGGSVLVKSDFPKMDNFCQDLQCSRKGSRKNLFPRISSSKRYFYLVHIS